MVFIRFIRSWVWVLVWALVGLVLRFQNLTEVLVQGRFYFVDADCYSRMTRAEMVSRAPGTVVRHHSFENWPSGSRSHATVPMDYLIVGGERCVRWFLPKSGWWASLQRESLDVSGALISPILGLLGVLLLGIWGRFLRDGRGEPVRGVWAVAAFWSISPPLVHATAFGRPDHQSLLVFLLAVTLISEVALWSRPSRWVAMVGGGLWGGGAVGIVF